MHWCHSFYELSNFLMHNTQHHFKHNTETLIEELADAVKDECQNRIGHYQPGWAPLADSTLERKARSGYGLGGDPNTPLYATGALRESIDSSVNKTALKASVGTNKASAINTELGTSRMPPRPVFEPSARAVIPSFLPRVQQLAAAGIVGISLTPIPQKGIVRSVFTP